MSKFLGLFLLWSQLMLAQTARHYANEFLNIGVDAGALGMGTAVIASSQNGTAGYWNPAGLSQINGQQINLMHAAYFANIAQYDYISYAKPINKEMGMGLSLIRFGVDNIMNTSQLIDEQGNINYDRITYFSAADYAFLLSIGKKNLLKNLSAGASAKIIYRHIGNFASGYGFGFDIGLQYQRRKWLLGFMLRDATTTFNYWTIDQNTFQAIADAIPGQNNTSPKAVELTLPKMQLGIARQFQLKKNWQLLTELDFNARFFQMNTLISSKFISIDPSLGLNFSYNKMAFIRLGINNFRKEISFDAESLKFQPNAGLGFKYKGLQLDYALTNIGSNNFFSHVFSLQIDLNYFLNTDN